MPALWALTTFKGVRGFSFASKGANVFEIYMHGSKHPIKPADGKYDTFPKKEDLTGGNWTFNPEKDIDWRGTGKTHLDALDEAFKRTGLNKEDFTPSKWGKTPDGKSIPVEWQGPNGSQVNMDIPEFNNVKPGGILGEGPHQPHIGYQTPGKGKNRVRGHIFVDNVPATR